MCENGQGSKFKFRLRDSRQLVSVNYSTFWNDFSHYSLFQTAIEEEILPLDYSKNLKQEDILFADKTKFIERKTNFVEFA